MTGPASPDAVRHEAAAAEAASAEGLHTGRSLASRLRGRVTDYQTLTKPRITLLVVITAGIGYALALRGGGGGAGGSWHAWGWVGLAGTLAGTALSCMAASVFNQVIERRTDAKMPRTADRPLAAGRVPVGEALALGLALTLAGQGLLCLLGTPLTSGLAAFTILSYALLYTPLKTVTPWALYVGAIPGAMPPLIGYAAVMGSIGLDVAGSAGGSGAAGSGAAGSGGAAGAWAVFLIMFVWQIPHFLAIGYLYRADYAAAGMAMHAVRDPSGRSSFRRAIAWCALLLPVGMLPMWLHVSGWIAFTVATVCGVVFLITAVDLAARPTRLRARRLFFASLIYLPVVLTVIMADPA